jgi:hypothetical protein
MKIEEDKGHVEDLAVGLDDVPDNGRNSPTSPTSPTMAQRTAVSKDIFMGVRRPSQLLQAGSISAKQMGMLTRVQSTVNSRNGWTDPDLGLSVNDSLYREGSRKPVGFIHKKGLSYPQKERAKWKCRTGRLSAQTATRLSPQHDTWVSTSSSADVEKYKWKTLQRKTDVVRRKHFNPVENAMRAAYLPLSHKKNDFGEGVLDMSALQVELAKRALSERLAEMEKDMAKEMWERQCTERKLTDAAAKRQLYHEILKQLRAQDMVNRCVSCCVDSDMGSVIEFYRRLFEVYNAKPSFQEMTAYLKVQAERVRGMFPNKSDLVHDRKLFPLFSTLMRRNAETNDDFHALVAGIIADCHGKYMEGPMKTVKSCNQKLERKYKNDHTKLVDVIRSTGVFKQARPLHFCLQQLLGNETLTIIRLTDRMNEPATMGYRDVKMNIKMPSGVICELQLHMDGFLKKKEELHKFYEIERMKSVKKDQVSAGLNPSAKKVDMALTQKELENIASRMAPAKQALLDAQTVHKEVEKAIKAGRKLSVGGLPQFQAELEERKRQKQMLEAEKLSFDPVSNSVGKAAKAAMTAMWTVQRATDGLSTSVKLAMHMYQQTASMVASRAANRAAEVAMVKLREVVRNMWNNQYNDRIVEVLEDADAIATKARLNMEFRKQLTSLQMRQKLGTLWKDEATKKQFLNEFTVVSDDYAGTYMSYVTKPLERACFIAWRAWAWCKRISGLPPPRVRIKGKNVFGGEVSDSEDEIEDEKQEEEQQASDLLRSPGASPTRTLEDHGSPTRRGSAELLGAEGEHEHGHGKVEFEHHRAHDHGHELRMMRADRMKRSNTSRMTQGFLPPARKDGKGKVAGPEEEAHRHQGGRKHSLVKSNTMIPGHGKKSKSKKGVQGQFVFNKEEMSKQVNGWKAQKVEESRQKKYEHDRMEFKEQRKKQAEVWKAQKKEHDQKEAEFDQRDQEEVKVWRRNRRASVTFVELGEGCPLLATLFNRQKIANEIVGLYLKRRCAYHRNLVHIEIEGHFMANSVIDMDKLKEILTSECGNPCRRARYRQLSMSMPGQGIRDAIADFGDITHSYDARAGARLSVAQVSTMKVQLRSARRSIAEGNCRRHTGVDVGEFAYDQASFEHMRQAAKVLKQVELQGSSRRVLKWDGSGDPGDR